MIAMALVCNPSLLIADEPTTALDVTIQAQVLDLMNEMRRKFSGSIMFITHDLGVVASMADDVIVMYRGKIVESASVRDLYRNPLHPYTQGLMRSVPSIIDRGETRFRLSKGRCRARPNLSPVAHSRRAAHTPCRSAAKMSRPWSTSPGPTRLRASCIIPLPRSGSMLPDEVLLQVRGLRKYFPSNGACSGGVPSDQGRGWD